ncbi:hypothetical protein QQS21_011814 [Conoideocrella luteorostrata]|uniref:Enterotoxin n=1 Tax=Conoideocrella luteorostrata TaxID=1105319 RepID=A0AAJ0CCD2_9HYPO|nr:hypothetical protein QQS21_011814 [Conoideocrella luteorostrata]
MHWKRFFVSAAPLWLSWLESVNASVLPNTTLARRQPNQTKGQYVYRGDNRSPREIREAGGFQPQGDHWEEDDQAFIIERHYHAGPRECHEQGFRTAYVSMAQQRETSENYGMWLYEIRATPNIINDGWPESEVMALGGAHWTQIRRYTHMRDTDDNRVDEAAWLDNPEYDRERFENPEYTDYYQVSDDFPEGLSDGNLPSDSDSDSGSDSEDSDPENNRRPQRRLFNAANRWMDRTDGIYETYGGFPPKFRPNTTPRDDVPGSPIPSTSSAGHDAPGPSRPSTSSAGHDAPGPSGPSTSSPANTNSEEESDVVRSLFHFLNISPERQMQVFPNQPQVVSAARTELEEGACPAWTSKHGSKRPSNSEHHDGSQGPSSSTHPGNSEHHDGSEGPSSSKLPGNSEHHDGSQGPSSSKHPGPSNPNAKNSKRVDRKLGLAIRDNGKGNIDGCCRVYKKLMKALPKRHHKSKGNDKDKGKKKAPKPASVVFVGDYLWPEEVKKQGGFLPRATTPSGPKYEIAGSNSGKEGDKVEIDLQTYLVPAFMTLGSAAHYAADSASKKTAGFSGIVYAIHATPNIINLGNNAAAVAGIRWSQVLGWMQVPENYSPPEDNPQERAKLKEHFTKAFKTNMTLFTSNKDYDHKFDRYKTTVNMQQDISNVNNLEEFMKKNGKAVGWTSGVPLLEGKAISGEASKAAKNENKVAAPHESSVWDNIKTYAKSHAVALALLPAVVALNFIPGLGEAADAAELAALGTESVEAIELEEAGASTLSGVGKGLTEILKDVAKLKVD